jgi:dihydropteroate synthase
LPVAQRKVEFPNGLKPRQPLIMGVLNVTPDSFSDGGEYLTKEAAVQRGLELAAEGAAIVDVGGESTRPGSLPVPLAEELRRVVPVIEGLREAGITAELSVDTRKAEVARQAVAAGATIVNDISALRSDPKMVEVVSQSRARLCLMHMQGEPRTMQAQPRYRDVVEEVREFLAERIAFCQEAGIAVERLIVDPGIGFGKTLAHNLALLANLERIAELGPPVLIGTSRKSFLGELAAAARGGPPPPKERLPGTIATNVIALAKGARIFRVHDVAPLRDALGAVAATLAADG